MYDADYPDIILPINGSTAALSYSGGLAGTAALTPSVVSAYLPNH